MTMMKKTIYLLLFACLTLQVSAQCVPDPSFTIPGVYPPAGSSTDTTAIILPAAQIGVPVNYVTQISVLSDTTVSLFGLTVNVPVDSLSIDSVNGLPPGMTATCDNPGCIWPGGGNGCIDLMGTPSSLGVYEITAYSATRLVFGAILDSTVVTPFIFKLSVVNNIGLADQPSQDFVLQPNPASEVVSIQFSEPLASERTYVLLDVLGRKVDAGEIPAFSATHSLYTGELKNGHYRLLISDGSDQRSRSLIIVD